MSSLNRPIADASNCRGRYCRLSRVFLMSGLGAIVLGAAFWPPAAIQRRLAVRLAFAEELSEADRQAKLAEVEAAVGNETERTLWAAEADAEGKPKPFVFAKLASFLPMAVRAESTLASSPIESDGNLTGIEVTFSDSDGLRAERFAQAIARSFERPISGSASASPAVPVASNPAKAAEREEALTAIRREQDRLRKALGDHFEELRSLRSELTDEVGSDKKDANGKKSTAGLAPVSLRLQATSLKNVLWQVPPSLSPADVERQIAALDADIAAKKAAREELLTKFTAHHPIASALAIAIERLERERRDLEELLSPSNDPVPTPPAQTLAPQATAPQPIAPRPVAEQPNAPQSVSPQPPAPQPTAPRTSAAPPASRPAPAPATPAVAAPKKEVSSAPVSTAPNSGAQAPAPVAPEVTASAAADAQREQEAAKEAAAAEIAAGKKAVAEALERAIRSEEALQKELRSLGEASQTLALESSVVSLGAPASPIVPPATKPSGLHASILDLEESERVENRFALLLAGSLLFACLMTALTWSVSRERAVGSAEEVRVASGLPVVGQSTAGLLDRKPKRNLASLAVSSSLKLVEGAAFATAVFCFAALAAENPRCEQILRQPLAIAWQALQSLT
ncbi:MAG TPA: hypothetical protein VGN57_03240 [Pirellulaceae bacterium]|jgi:hypothetical protein|nr:hypothetical protein [Pirellulaceae bacterium]